MQQAKVIFSFKLSKCHAGNAMCGSQCLYF